MPIARPAGIECPKWEPTSLTPGEKRCRYYISPGDLDPSGLCKLPDELLCVEWVRRHGSDDQKRALKVIRSQPGGPPAAPRTAERGFDPDEPPPLVLEPPRPLPARAPATVRTPGGVVQLAPPKPFEPAKEIDPTSIEALERAGVEVELSAPHLAGAITLVPARTGRIDRNEITFREAATIRLIVDAFPGAHVTAYRAGTGGAAMPVSNGVLFDALAHAGRELAFEEYPMSGTTCSVCKKPQRRTPGGLSCGEHGGADELAVVEEDMFS